MKPTMGNRAKGIDVSHWRPVKDWKAVKDSGVSFVGMKATEGNTLVDSTLVAHRDAFRKNDFILGVYFHFARSGDPVAQAKRFISAIGPLMPNERLALDLEVMIMLKASDTLSWIESFMETIATAYPDRRPIMYTSERIWRSIGYPDWPTATAGLNQCPPGVDLWAPKYNLTMEPLPPKPWATVGWKFWQWTDGNDPESLTPGIGKCDANYFNGDEDALKAYAQLTPQDSNQPPLQIA
jgi:lysozyme